MHSFDRSSVAKLSSSFRYSDDDDDDDDADDEEDDDDEETTAEGTPRGIPRDRAKRWWNVSSELGLKGTDIRPGVRICVYG